MSSIRSILSFSALALFAPIAQGHMIMATPPPYGSPDNSPLNADGSNFPCKATSNSGGTVTGMAIGASQKLSFLGESVHGGGSCQISLTTDTPATKSSKWMVIHSIEGGCPARNQAGNIGADNSASAPDPDTYDFSIPAGVSPGAYTLAWTWFNKVGNREMYMNCASIKVTSASRKRETPLNETPLNETQEYAISELSERATTSFPAMFVANIPVSDCTTVQGADVKFPDPGASVENASANKANILAPPAGPKCGASGSSSGASADTETPNASSPGASGDAAPATAPSISVAAPAVAASSSVTAASPSVIASPSAGSAPAPAVNSAGPSAAPASGSGMTPTGSSTGSCTTPGQSICSPDGLQIGTCTEESTVTWIPVAAGTKCAGGYMVAAKGKRSAKFLSDYFF